LSASQNSLSGIRQPGIYAHKDIKTRMSKIIVDVALYGPIARYGGGQSIAQVNVDLSQGARMLDLLQHFGIPDEEKGYCFINAVLCDAPGLTASHDEPLHGGDHVGIFSIKHMWPYQYRDGIRMTESLTNAMKKQGVMRHTYKKSD
jgi:hypothetical protein